MKIILRTRWSAPINLGLLALAFFLVAIIKADSILNPYLIVLSVLFIISLVRFLGTRLIISDEFLEYQYWLFKKKKVLIKDIEDVKIQKGKIREFLEISTPDMSFKIFPYSSVTLLSIMGLITGRPYKFEEAQDKLKQQLKKKRKIDFALVGSLVFVFLALFSFRVAVMNQPKVVLVRITPKPVYPLVTELDNSYSLYVGDIRIWNIESAADAALNALKPELSFFSKLFSNKYLVYYNNDFDYYNDFDQFYVIYKFGSPNEPSYVCYVLKGGNVIYFRAYEEA